MSDAGEAENIYVLDREAESRAQIARMLREAGFQPVLFDSEMALFCDFRPTHPACLIVNDEMPLLTGSRIRCLLHAAGCEVPLIFLSAQPAIEQAVQAMRAGAVAFLSKPADPALLLPAVHRMLHLGRVQIATVR